MPLPRFGKLQLLNMILVNYQVFKGKKCKQFLKKREDDYYLVAQKKKVPKASKLLKNSPCSISPQKMPQP